MAALALIGSWAWNSRPGDPGALIVYVEDPETVGAYVELGRTGILTAENFVGHRIRVVEGALRNVSDRTLRSVELRLSFRSVGGEPVLESDDEALTLPLDPGGERRYVFRFENLPGEWDYRVPDVRVIRVGM